MPGSNWISDVQWDPQGRPYRTYLKDSFGRRAGDRAFVSPAEVSPQHTQDPRLLSWAAQTQRPGQSLLQNRGTWNPQTGKWDQGTNWTNIASMGVGGLIAAPAIAGALAGGGGSTLAGIPAGTLPGGGAAPFLGAVPSATASGGAALASTAPIAAAAAPVTASTLPGALPAFTETVAVNAAMPPLASSPWVAPALAAAATGAATPTLAHLLGEEGAEQPITPNTPGATDTVWGSGLPTAMPPILGNNGLFNTGIDIKDLIGFGAGLYDRISTGNQNQEASEANLAAQREALAFAMRAYDEQNAKEQARWDANELRRGPYRAASLSALAALKQVLGLT